MKNVISIKGFLTVFAISVMPILFFSTYYYGILGEDPKFVGRSIVQSTLIDWSFSFLVTYSIIICGALLHEVLEKHHPWERGVVGRIAKEGITISIVAGSIIAGWTLLYNAAFEICPEKELPETLFKNIATAVIISIVVTAIWESIALFNLWKTSVLEAERLKREHLQSQFQSLKAQINPHFLFNSLNALSSLIHTDTEKAEQFIDEFAKVYRYVLEVKDRNVIELKEELRFMDSFLFLQQMRFGENLVVEQEVDAALFVDGIPPLALQEVIENAIKHNEISQRKPLKIEVYSEGRELIVRNNLQPRQEDVPSTGSGLKNLRDRYSMFAHVTPSFMTNGSHYIARLPLIEREL